MKSISLKFIQAKCAKAIDVAVDEASIAESIKKAANAAREHNSIPQQFASWAAEEHRKLADPKARSYSWVGALIAA